MAGRHARLVASFTPASVANAVCTEISGEASDGKIQGFALAAPPVIAPAGTGAADQLVKEWTVRAVGVE